MSKQKLFLLLLLGLFVLKVHSQNNPYKEVTIASPTAASLGKFVDVPVNNHTGIPNISVPIYSVKEGPLELPISLSYHAGGVKVMEPASWVGTGWALNAGGVITRSVQGIPDEAANTATGQYGHFKNYGYSNYLTQGPPRSVGTGEMPNDAAFSNGIYDGEPDLFFFNFAGYSGKFYFNDDRTPILIGDEDLKIEYYYPAETASSYTNETANIQGFIITTPNGDKYYFGINPGGSAGGDNAVEITFPYSSQNTNVASRVYSSWYLTKVVSADGLSTINLIYQSEKYSYYTISMYPIDPAFQPSMNNPSNNEYMLVKNYMEGVRLSQITFSNGVVNFMAASSPRTDLSNSHLTNGYGFNEYSNTEAKALDAISISDNNGFCKKFQFHYSYFQDNTSSLPGYFANYTLQTDKQRLKLDSLIEKSCNNSIVNPPYKFEYYSNFLPRRLSFAQDHWGYYNGATSNNTLIPTYTIKNHQFVTGANREPKWPEMRNGALNKIVYPTGGNTVMEFEPHTTHINATRYNEVFFNSYGVGYDNNTSYTASNVALSGNYYKVTISYATCQAGTANCAAEVKVIDNSNNWVFILSTTGGNSNTGYFQLPAGNYTIFISRGTSQSNNIASATFTEIVPVQFQGNEIVGGLRIKNVTMNATGTSTPVVTNYSYNVNNNSSGMLYSRPTYVQVIRNEVVQQFGFSGGTSSSNTHDFPNGCMNPEIPGSNTMKYYKSPCGILPMATTQGNHIGYNEVKVSQTGNGYKIYRYYGSNVWDNRNDDICYRNVNPSVCDPNIATSPAAPQPYEYKRGELKYEGFFNESGQLLKDVSYTMVFDSTKVFTPCYVVQNILGHMLGTQYIMRGYYKKQLETIEKDYVPGGGSTTAITTSYAESPYHHQITRQVTTNSKGETIITKTKYSFDYRNTDCDQISDCWQSYVSSTTTCNQTAYNQTNSCTSVSCRYWAWIDKLICNANARKAYVTCRRNNFTNVSNAFAACLQNAKNAADANLKPILELRQAFRLVPIEVTQWKNNQLKGASFYSYDYASNPSSKVYISKTQLINLAAPSTTFTESAVSGSTISKDSRYKDETTVKFDAGNLVELVKKDGIINSYLWGYNNNQPAAKITGVSFADLASAGISQTILQNPETDEALRTELNKIRTTFPSAFVTTYTYKPLVGMTSQTDANGRTTYYQYDALGRLQLIKDKDGNVIKTFEYKYKQ